MSNTTICAELTEQPESLWLHNPVECTSMIQRKYDAYETMIEIVIYFFVMYMISSYSLSIGYDMICRSRRRDRQLPPPTDVTCQKIMYYISNND